MVSQFAIPYITNSAKSILIGAFGLICISTQFRNIMPIDFRSDTVTRPTAAMMQAMMQAKVGDDVFGEDPSINELEATTARLFGMEAALFCPSGTMSNQVAIKCHTRPGDEIICEKNSHVYIYEGGGIAFNSGSQVRAIEGDRGRITAEQVVPAINPDDVHKARTSLVCLENTCNRGGGSYYDREEIKRIGQVCKENKLKLHLDGARLFNALVAEQGGALEEEERRKEKGSRGEGRGRQEGGGRLEERGSRQEGGGRPEERGPRQEGNWQGSARWYGAQFDSISVCLNKGLGCPIGSMLLGSAEFIRQARRVRKVFGGGMRQAGFMASAGIYALDHHVDRLAEDHLHARQIAEALAKKEFVRQILPVETNIVILDMAPGHEARVIIQKLKEQDILVIAISPTQLRFVTHLDISSVMVEQAIAVIGQL